MKNGSLRLYEFGPFRLNATERVLQRGADVVPLTPKVIDTLVVLVENCGHIISKDDLMQELWPDSFVEESSLTQNVSLLRKALGDNGGDWQYIETIPKRGYRFTATVREVTESPHEIILQERTSTQILVEEKQIPSEEPAPPAKSGGLTGWLKRQDIRRRRYRVIVAASCILISISTIFYWLLRNRAAKDDLAVKSIAVLPFQIIGPHTEQEHLGLGMADALILRLSRSEPPTVLPTSSVFKYTNRDKDALSIGKELGVNTVFDGVLQRDGDRVRVTARIIRVDDGKTLWSGKFDEDYRDIFALQDSISAQVGNAIMPQQIFTTKDRLANRLPKNTEAYNAYLTGLHFWNFRTKDNLAKAIQYFEEAVEKDPNFALGHALLADSYYLSTQSGYHIVNGRPAIESADSAATRALQLDDKTAEAHTVKGGIMFANRNFGAADQHFRRALELYPGYAVGHLRYGYFLFSASKPEEALHEMKLAQQFDPVSPISNSAFGYMLYMTRDNDGAIKAFKRALELQPDGTAARFNLGLAYVQKGLFEQAHDEFERLRNTEPALFAEGGAYAFAASGHRREAMRMLSELRRQSSYGQVTPYQLTVFYATMGDNDTALKWLDKVQINRAIVARLRFEPQLDRLRADGRFAEFLKRHQLGAVP